MNDLVLALWENSSFRSGRGFSKGCNYSVIKSFDNALLRLFCCTYGSASVMYSVTGRGGESVLLCFNHTMSSFLFFKGILPQQPSLHIHPNKRPLLQICQRNNAVHPKNLATVRTSSTTAIRYKLVNTRWRYSGSSQNYPWLKKKIACTCWRL